MAYPGGSVGSRDGLLTSRTRSESYPSQGSWEASEHRYEVAGGKPGRLILRTDGAVEFSHGRQGGPLTRALRRLLCLDDGGIFPASPIPEAELLGAELVGERSARVWWSPRPIKGDAASRRAVATAAISFANAGEAEAAVAAARGRAAGRGGPRRVLVIVNPRSGRGRAPRLWKTRVSPLLAAAGIEAVAIETLRPGHAVEIARKLDLSSVDALACLGGDGTAHEALQGLLTRPDWERASRLPIVLVPGGSGNALGANTGLRTPDAAILALVKGRTRRLDIASVVAPGGRRTFSFLSLTYGLIPALDVGTDHLRWMGELRFTLGAIWNIAKGKSFRMRAAYVAAEPSGGDGVADPESTPPVAAVAAAAEASGGVGQALSGPPLRFIDPSLAGGPPGGGDGAAFPAGPTSLPAPWTAFPATNVELFAACNLAWLDTTFHVAPGTRPDDGELGVIWTSNQGRIGGLRILVAAEHGSHMNLVEHLRARALALFPETSDGTWVVVDGEAVPFEPVLVEVHPQLCTVIFQEEGSA